jgi:hypothetical protein
MEPPAGGQSPNAGAGAAFPLHYEISVRLDVTPATAFAYLDDFRRLSAHMEKASAMMLGSRMRITCDEGEGRAIGSNIHMEGRLFGIAISLDEVVTRRHPPWEKAWKTVRTKLVVIGRYVLGFQLSSDGAGSGLRVHIDYELPDGGSARWLAKWLGEAYARWCVRRMTRDAVRHFDVAI